MIDQHLPGTLGEDEPTDPPAKKKRGFWRELPVLVVAALLIALLIKAFLVQLFWIPSDSMVPTLERNDRIVVNRLAYDFGGPSRGDVVVFRNPSLGAEPPRGVLAGALHWFGEGLGIGRAPDEDYVKRVIGIAGDTVKVTTDAVFVNGKQLDEPYVASEGGPTGTWTVPDGDVFVMGDNRMHSEDSRFFGAIPVDSIVGKAFVRVWPPSRLAGL